ncbi:glucosidase II beta subunit-like-domain-containing protein [Dipodascopsis uninucleata]
MKYSKVISAGFITVACLKATECAKPVVIRGILKADEPFYKADDNGKWACLSYPEIIISESRINDDFCDCPDGSDEPGTSACSNGVFKCLNKGHISGELPSSRVNDGVCDYDICCDGSDEWSGIVKCENRCKEMAADYAKKQAEQLRAQQAGWAARTKLMSKAAAAKSSLEKEIRDLDNEINNMESVRARAEEQAKLAELKATSHTGKKSSLALDRARTRLKEYQKGTKALNERVNVLVERLEQAEAILKLLKQEYNPNYNDEGVKAAIHAFDEYSANPPTLSPTYFDEISIITNGDISDDELFELDDGEFEMESTKYNSYIPLKWRLWIHDKKEQLRELLISNGLLAERSPIGETADVSKAKRELSQAEKSLEDLKNRKKTLEKDLATNFGVEDVFRALKGDCISSDMGEYTYELCFMDKTTQQSKTGGRTNLGGFDRLEDNKLYFTRGTKCWNGPHRSTVVEMTCGERNEIYSVSEPAMCEYLFKILTPAICTKPVESNSKKGKDEL